MPYADAGRDGDEKEEEEEERAILDEQERVEAQITSVLRDVDANYVRAHELATRLLNTVHAFGSNARKVRDASRLWQSYFARVAHAPQPTGVAGAATGSDAAASSSANATDRTSTSATAPPTSRVLLGENGTSEVSLDLSRVNSAGAGRPGACSDESTLPHTPTFRDLSLSPPNTPALRGKVAVRRSSGGDEHDKENNDATARGDGGGGGGGGDNEGRESDDDNSDGDGNNSNAGRCDSDGDGAPACMADDADDADDNDSYRPTAHDSSSLPPLFDSNEVEYDDEARGSRHRAKRANGKLRGSASGGGGDDDDDDNDGGAGTPALPFSPPVTPVPPKAQCRHRQRDESARGTAGAGLRARDDMHHRWQTRVASAPRAQTEPSRADLSLSASPESSGQSTLNDSASSLSSSSSLHAVARAAAPIITAESAAKLDEFDVRAFPPAFREGDGALQLTEVYAQFFATRQRTLSLRRLRRLLPRHRYDEDRVRLLCEMLVSRRYLRAAESDGRTYWRLAE